MKKKAPLYARILFFPIEVFGQYMSGSRFGITFREAFRRAWISMFDKKEEK